MPNYDAVNEKQLELQTLLKQLWTHGHYSEKDYRQKLRGISRCIMQWRNARNAPAFILIQLAAVEDELMAGFSPRKQRRKA